jgi:DNA-binding transcriptional LysR family regulator
MQLASLDLNLLLAFEALFEERSVTAGARRLGIGQPGMSAALSRLRKRLGDELFVHVRGEMRPTAKAAEMAPGIAAALAQLRRTLEASVAFDPAAATRSFAVGSPDYTTLVLLPALAAHVGQRAPGVDLRVIGYEKGTVPEMLDKGELDVALGVFPDPPERAVVKPLFRERFVGIARAGHPAIHDGRIEVARFAALLHALVTTKRDATGALDEALARHGLRRRIALTLPYALALPAVLQGSDLIAAVPSRLADRVLCDGALQRFELPVETPAWTVAMLWPASARNDQGAAWLRETIVACAGSA